MICSFDEANFDLRYTVAEDAQGISWDAPLSIDDSGTVRRTSSMAIIDGRPAITYECLSGELRYLRLY